MSMRCVTSPTAASQPIPAVKRTLALGARLRERYGAAEGEQLASGVEQFIDSRADLAKRLQGGLRSHPAVTEMLAALVRRAKSPQPHSEVCKGDFESRARRRTR